jgi:hypothetical protein
MTKPRQEFLGSINLLDKALTGTIDLSSARVTNGADPINNKDLTTKEWVLSHIPASNLGAVLSSGNTADGYNIDLQNVSKVINSPDPVNSQDLVTLNYFTTHTGGVPTLSNVLATGNSTGTHNISVVDGYKVVFGNNGLGVDSYISGAVGGDFPGTVNLYANNSTIKIAPIVNPALPDASGQISITTSSYSTLTGGGKESLFYVQPAFYIPGITVDTWGSPGGLGYNGIGGGLGWSLGDGYADFLGGSIGFSGGDHYTNGTYSVKDGYGATWQTVAAGGTYSGQYWDGWHAFGGAIEMFPLHRDPASTQHVTIGFGSLLYAKTVSGNAYSSPKVTPVINELFWKRQDDTVEQITGMNYATQTWVDGYFASWGLPQVLNINSSSGGYSIDLGNNSRVINALDPVNNQDYTTKVWVTNLVDGYFAGWGLSQVLAAGNSSGSYGIDLNNTNKIINAADPTSPQDYATKNYVDGYFSSWGLPDVLGVNQNTSGHDIAMTTTDKLQFTNGYLQDNGSINIVADTGIDLNLYAPQNIIAGANNSITGAYHSVISGGAGNTISYSLADGYNVITGGKLVNINNSSYSSITGGSYATINNSSYCLFGVADGYSYIQNGTKTAVIVGGTGTTAITNTSVLVVGVTDGGNVIDSVSNSFIGSIDSGVTVQGSSNHVFVGTTHNGSNINAATDVFIGSTTNTDITTVNNSFVATGNASSLTNTDHIFIGAVDNATVTGGSHLFVGAGSSPTFNTSTTYTGIGIVGSSTTITSTSNSFIGHSSNTFPSNLNTVFIGSSVNNSTSIQNISYSAIGSAYVNGDIKSSSNIFAGNISYGGGVVLSNNTFAGCLTNGAYVKNIPDSSIVLGINGSYIAKGLKLQDSNTLIRWKLDETSGPWYNSGTSGSLDLNTIGGTVGTGVGVEGNTLLGNAISITPGNGAVYTGDTSVQPTGSALTVSAWVKLNSYTSGGMFVCKKYDIASAGWSAPYATIYLGLTGALDGTWLTGVTVGGTLTQPTISSTIPLGTWTLVSITFDGTNLRTYLNGSLVDTTAVTGGPGALDYGNNGPWSLGDYIASSALGGQILDGLVDDVRIEGVVRSASYLLGLYNSQSPYAQGCFIGTGSTAQIYNSDRAFIGTAVSSYINESSYSAMVSAANSAFMYDSDYAFMGAVSNGSNISSSDNAAIIASTNGSYISNSQGAFIGTANYGTNVNGSANAAIVAGSNGANILNSANAFMGTPDHSAYITASPHGVMVSPNNSSYLDTSPLSFIGTASSASYISGSSSAFMGAVDNGAHIINSSFASILSGNGGAVVITGSAGSSMINTTNGCYIDTSPRSTIINGDYTSYILNSTGSFLGGVTNGCYVSGGTYSAVVSGSNSHVITSNYSSITSGINHIIDTSSDAFIGGGDTNQITSVSDYAAIVSGRFGTITASANAFIGSGSQNTILTSSGNSAILGGSSNTITSSTEAAIASGNSCSITSAQLSFIGGGATNSISNSTQSFIGNGYGNNISATGGEFNAIVGGQVGSITAGSSSTIIGGYNNRIDNSYCVISGKDGYARMYGQEVRANGYFSSQGDAQKSEIIVKGTAAAGVAFDLYTTTTTEIVFEDGKTYDISVKIVAVDITDGTKRARWSYDVLAHQTAGTITIDDSTLISSVTTGTDWAVTISNGGGSLFRIRLDASADATRDRRAMATIEWREIRAV